MLPSAYAQEAKVEDRVSADQQVSESARELEEIRARLEEADTRRAKLKREIGQLDKDRESINRALLLTAARAQDIENDIFDSERRLDALEQDKTAIRKSLVGKEALLAEILAALQRMGRNPPPAILIRPKDALASIRSSILVGSVVPSVRAETEALVGQLTDLAAIEVQIDEERTALAVDLNRLADDESRLALLQKEKTELAQKSRAAMKQEQARAEELARKATSLEDLIGQLEDELASAAKAAEAARKADEARRTAELERLAKAQEALARGEQLPTTDLSKQRAAALDPQTGSTQRTEPAIAFEDSVGLLPFPAAGRVVSRFGDGDGVGGRRPNLAMAVRANATIRSPADGWVVYAGAFRSYGQLLILNTGNDYHIVLSGMNSLDVQTGQFVLSGEPVGKMGLVRVAAATGLDLSSAQPVLYVEFRKDGKPIDPDPWWSDAANVRSSNDS